ncbi:MAG: hypothetical protein ACR2L1_00795, partial [Pyrinomonadaceae bacterium]
PENRYASAAAMREDLRRILRGEAIFNLLQPSHQHNNPALEVSSPDSEIQTYFIKKDEDEKETVLKVKQSKAETVLVPEQKRTASELSEELTRISGKNRKKPSLLFTIFALLAVPLIVGLLGLGVIFLKRDTITNSNFANSANRSYYPTPVYPSETLKPKRKTPKSEPNKIYPNVNMFVEPQTSTNTSSQSNRHCYLTSSSGTVNMRKDCNVKDCDDDDATIAGSISNGVEIDFKGVSVPSRFGFQWEKVLVDEAGVYWVASSKISCEN